MPSGALALLRLLTHLQLGVGRRALAARFALALHAALLRLAGRLLEQRRHAHAGAELHRLAGRAHLELIVRLAACALLALRRERIVEQLLLIGYDVAQIFHHAAGALLLRVLDEIPGL